MEGPEEDFFAKKVDTTHEKTPIRWLGLKLIDDHYDDEDSKDLSVSSESTSTTSIDGTNAQF